MALFTIKQVSGFGESRNWSRLNQSGAWRAFCEHAGIPRRPMQLNEAEGFRRIYDLMAGMAPEDRATIAALPQDEARDQLRYGWGWCLTTGQVPAERPEPMTVSATARREACVSAIRHATNWIERPWSADGRWEQCPVTLAEYHEVCRRVGRDGHRPRVSHQDVLIRPSWGQPAQRPIHDARQISTAESAPQLSAVHHGEEIVLTRHL